MAAGKEKMKSIKNLLGMSQIFFYWKSTYRSFLRETIFYTIKIVILLLAISYTISFCIMI